MARPSRRPHRNAPRHQGPPPDPHRRSRRSPELLVERLRAPRPRHRGPTLPRDEHYHRHTLPGTTIIQPVPIPLHCRDGFNEAYYGRPPKNSSRRVPALLLRMELCRCRNRPCLRAASAPRPRERLLGFQTCPSANPTALRGLVAPADFPPSRFLKSPHISGHSHRTSAAFATPSRGVDGGGIRSRSSLAPPFPLLIFAPL